jgi:2-methylcitrate dehydratase PrpD
MDMDTSAGPHSGLSAASVTEALARFAVALRLEAVPSAVVDHAKLCLLDFAGATLAGAKAPAAQPLGEFVRGQGGAPEGSVWGFGCRAPAALAALVNGAVGHHLELDDGHILGHVHPGATLIPAAFALAEGRRATGRDLLTAIVAGYEIVIRVGRGIAASAMYDRGYHGPGLFGAFGAAAAAASVLRLDADRAADGLGNCCLTPAATFQAFKEGAGVKDLYCGWPAMTGTLAAQFAAAGISGPRQLLEGRLGLARAVADRHDLGSITADLGQAWLLPTAYIKRHSACSFAHTMIDALLDLTAAGPFRPEAIQRITVFTHRFAAELNEQTPATLTAAKSSLPFCAALAATRGHALLTDFTAEALADPELLALAARTTIAMDPGLDARHSAREDRRPARVEITFADGRRLTAAREIARGWAEDPMTPEEIRGKFTALVEPGYGPERARTILAAAEGLESLDDVTSLGTLLTAR